MSEITLILCLLHLSQRFEKSKVREEYVGEIILKSVKFYDHSIPNRYTFVHLV